VYEDAFCGLDDEPEVCRRTGCQVALRLPDPEGRNDQSGRLIIHEFVIEGSAAQGVETPEDGRERIWPLVAAEYAEVYDSDRKSTRLNSSHVSISYAVFCLKKKNIKKHLLPA